MKLQNHKFIQPLYKKFNLIFAVFLAIVLFGSRWKSIVYPLPLSLDEAEIASHVMRIVAHGYNWDVLDGGTIGPFTSLIVAWPTLLGLDTTLGAIRITGCVLLAFICFFVYLSIKLVSRDWLAFLFTLPLVLFYALTASDDFLHFNSEVFPIFLLVFANYLVLDVTYQNVSCKKWKYLYVGLLLGTVPFTKLQGAPIALVIGLYSCYLAISSKKVDRAENITYLISGAVFPALFLLIPLLCSGHIFDFWQSYIVWSGVYVDNSTSILDIVKLIQIDVMLSYFFYFAVFLSIAIVFQLCLLKKPICKLDRLSGITYSYQAMVLLSACIVISIPGRLHLHYLMFLPPFLLIFIGQFCASFKDRISAKISFTRYYFFGVALLLMVFFYGGSGVSLQRAYAKYDTGLKKSLTFTNSKILSWLPMPENSLLVWGWMPQWYLLTDLTPALRGGSTFGQFVPSKLMTYYREQFMIDFAKSSPNVIIDAVSNNREGFNVPSKFSPSVFPEFESIILKQYSRLSGVERSKGCPEIYVKKEYKKFIDEKILIPKSVSASNTMVDGNNTFSKDKLFDLSVSEEACVDYWLLPEKTLGTLYLQLSKQEVVSSLKILNTQNSFHLDRASKEVNIKLYNRDRIVLERMVRLNLYPDWTNVEWEKPVNTDRIEIAILSYFGLGAGLNEIKIYRSD